MNKSKAIHLKTDTWLSNELYFCQEKWRWVSHEQRQSGELCLNCSFEGHSWSRWIWGLCWHREESTGDLSS